MTEETAIASSENFSISHKIAEARQILELLDFPKQQLNSRSAMTLLALLNLQPSTPWIDSQKPLIGITPIMDWCREYYSANYAPNSRETFRKQTMHQFVEAALAVPNPDKPTRPTNSPQWCYQIELDAFELLCTFGTSRWEANLDEYKRQREGLKIRYARQRDMNMVPVSVAENKRITLSPGQHSELITAIIEKFGPRYAPGGKVLYIGDTGIKWGYIDHETLSQLGIQVDSHGKMPDLVIYLPDKNWLLLIEAVTSSGPVDAKRHSELTRLFGMSKAGLVFVTAFASRSTMARYLTEISWETEVWIADAPDHLIHFNGERFLGPYVQSS